MLSKLSSLLFAATTVSAHYFLQSPPSIGFDDTTLTTAPCGGFSATDRSGGVTDWPVSGYPFSVITTHLNVIWTFKAALITNGVVGAFQDIYPNVHQTGISEFCLPLLPGVQEWIGKDAVFQVVQQAPDGDLHQCAAIRFISGSPAPQGEDCNNSTSVSATTVPGTGPMPTVTLDTSSSTTSPPSTTSKPPTTTEDSTTSEPTAEPTNEPTTATGEPTSTIESSMSEEPTEHSHSTTSGGDHEPTDTPVYTPPTYNPTLTSYTSVSSNATMSMPDPPPPSYTGAAGTVKSIGISFIVAVTATVFFAL